MFKQTPRAGLHLPHVADLGAHDGVPGLGGYRPPLISTRLPLTRWQEAFDRVMAKRSIKTLLYPDD